MWRQYDTRVIQTFWSHQPEALQGCPELGTCASPGWRHELSVASRSQLLRPSSAARIWHRTPEHSSRAVLSTARVTAVRLLQVRTFLQLPWGTKVLDGETRAALTRLVESWAFHESLLEQGKRLLQQGFLDACITMARLQRQIPQAPVPPNILGHLDTLAVILSNDVGLRKQIMATLRKMLPLRQMCLLLVVQVRVLLRSDVPASIRCRRWRVQVASQCVLLLPRPDHACAHLMRSSTGPKRASRVCFGSG